MLKIMNIDNPTEQQKLEEKKAIKEHHTILFMLGANKYKYGKLIEDMKNDVPRKKDPFHKTIAEACHVPSKWKNHYSGKYNNNKSKSNDGIAFATVTEEKEQKKSEKRRKHASEAKRWGSTPMSTRKMAIVCS